MTDDFNKMLWSMATDSPALQQAILGNKSTESVGYSIPTRRYSRKLGEVGDIHSYYLDLTDDESEIESLTQTIKKIDSLTVGELANRLGFIHVALSVKEAEDLELSEVEKTLKDIDITALAMTVIKATPKVVKDPPHEEPIREE